MQFFNFGPHPDSANNTCFPRGSPDIVRFNTSSELTLSILEQTLLMLSQKALGMRGHSHLWGLKELLETCKQLGTEIKDVNYLWKVSVLETEPGMKLGRNHNLTYECSKGLQAIIFHCNLKYALWWQMKLWQRQHLFIHSCCDRPVQRHHLIANPSSNLVLKIEVVKSAGKDSSGFEMTRTTISSIHFQLICFAMVTSCKFLENLSLSFSFLYSRLLDFCSGTKICKTLNSRSGPVYHSAEMGPVLHFASKECLQPDSNDKLSQSALRFKTFLWSSYRHWVERISWLCSKQEIFLSH